MNAKRRPWRHVVAKGSVLHSTLVLTSGTAVAQVLTVICTPILTRLYDPAVFGIFGTFTGIVTVLVPLAGLSLPLAIIFSDSPDDRVSLVRLSCAMTAIVAIGVATLVAIWRSPIAELLGLGNSSYVLYLAPVAILMAGASNLSRHVNLYLGQFGRTARANVLHAAFLNLAQVSLGLFHPSPATLTGAYSGAFAVQAVAQVPPRSRPLRRLFRSRATPWWETLSKYRDYPLYRAPQTLFNSANQYAPIFVLATVSGPAAAGWYALSRMAIMAPSQLIGRSIFEAISPKLGRASRDGELLYPHVSRAGRSLALLGVVPFGFLAFFGPDVFGTLFGSGWDRAGEYVRWMAAGTFIAFLNRPYVAAIPALGLQRWFMWYEVSSLIARFSAIPLSRAFGWDDLETVVHFSALSAILNALLIWRVSAKARASDALLKET